MIRYGHPLANVERLPLTAALGLIYAARLTGTLKVLDGGGTSVPFLFWFKRGFPCHSYSRDGVARLGEQVERGKRELVRRCLERNRVGRVPGKTLAGQLLLSESLITMDELQEALVRQLTARLVCCASLADVTFQFDDGMDEFGVVPLSSPLLNPVEVGARTAASASYERVRAYLLENIEETHVRLAMDRRIPPAARAHLAEAFIDSLAEPVEVSRILEVPSRMRTLGFLLPFGFVEPLHARMEHPAQQPVEQPGSPVAMPADRLADMVRLVRTGASHYELLGLSLDATRSQIKQLYRHVAFLIHPDRVAPSRAADSRTVFPHLVEAYHTLSKERLRVKYDHALVTSGGSSALGDPATVCLMLEARRDHLTRLGLTTLASEYVRMCGSLQGRPEPFPATSDEVRLRW